MNLFSRRPRGKKQNKTKRKILVISGGGARGTYALGIMKAMEECGIKEKIDAIYGVSIGAIVGSVWSNGMKAEEIFELLTNLSIKDFIGMDIFTKLPSFLSNKKIENIISEHLPKNIEELKIPVYIGCVDTNNAKYKLFNNGDLQKIVLGSIAIPGIFPAIKYGEYSLIDGGVLNNFPVDIAKQHHPNHEIIGIALNKFKTNQNIKTPVDNLQVTLEVIMRSKLLENTKFVDYLFYKDLPIQVLSLNKKQMHEAFALGYEDGIKMFKESS